ncbi:MAG: TerB family tellurite resistance protein [Candidatus Eremiobacteraeota bacterium]|mgnify:CR=1 FL=1|nr:TerB family tellurite resistance protein [Candidatus Eremiobacteraeota bacterium]
MDAQNKEIIKSLVKMAWADGEVSHKEQELLAAILLKMGCSEEEVDGLGEAPEEDPRLDEVLPDKESRMNIMRALMTMSFVDGILSFDEFAYINRLAEQLDISNDELETLRQEALVAADDYA